MYYKLGGHQPLLNPQQSINMKYKRGGGGVVANRTVRKQIGAKMAVHGNNQHVKERPNITEFTYISFKCFAPLFV